MMLKFLIRSGLAASIFWAGTVPAAGQPILAGPPGAGCTDAAYRQLDFRLGDFEVTAAEDTPAGLSRIESLLGGCLILEHWRAAISGHGRAHFFYGRSGEAWKLVYVGDEGNILHLSGGMEGDSMVLSGINDFDTFAGLHQMRFFPLGGGDHKQVWTISNDGGATWTLIHEGTYMPAGKLAP